MIDWMNFHVSNSFLSGLVDPHWKFNRYFISSLDVLCSYCCSEIHTYIDKSRREISFQESVGCVGRVDSIVNMAYIHILNCKHHKLSNGLAGYFGRPKLKDTIGFNTTAMLSVLLLKNQSTSLSWYNIPTWALEYISHPCFFDHHVHSFGISTYLVLL